MSFWWEKIYHNPSTFYDTAFYLNVTLWCTGDPKKTQTQQKITNVSRALTWTPRCVWAEWCSSVSQLWGKLVRGKESPHCTNFMCLCAWVSTDGWQTELRLRRRWSLSHPRILFFKPEAALLDFANFHSFNLPHYISHTLFWTTLRNGLSFREALHLHPSNMILQVIDAIYHVV